MQSGLVIAHKCKKALPPVVKLLAYKQNRGGRAMMKIPLNEILAKMPVEALRAFYCSNDFK